MAAVKFPGISFHFAETRPSADKVFALKTVPEDILLSHIFISKHGNSLEAKRSYVRHCVR